MSFFKATDFRISLWDNPSINTEYINTPTVPFSIDTDISIFTLFTNFFSDLNVDYIEVESEPLLEFETNESGLKNIVLIEKQEVKPQLNISLVIKEKKDIKKESVIVIVDEPNHNKDIHQIQNSSHLPKKSGTIQKQKNEKVVMKKEIIKPEKKAKKVKKPQVDKDKPLVDNWYPIKSDEQIIQDSPYIKENAKKILLKSLKDKTISIEDVERLLSEYSGEIIKKKYVKKLIKSK